MSRTQSRIAWSLVLLLAVGLGVGFTFPFGGNAAPEPKSPAPETLLPAASVLYFGADGRDAHKAEFERTAAYDAIYKSGLADVFGKAVDWGFARIGKQSGVGGYDLFKKTYSTINGKGLSLAVSVSADVGPPKPWAILVLHEAGDLEPQLGGMIKKVAGKKLRFETKTVSGRTVTRADIPAPGAPFKLEIGWWKEGKHLVLVGGADAVTAAIDVAAGKKPNITTNPLWKKYHGKSDFTVASVGWFDLGTLRKMFGKMPVPRLGTREAPKTVNDVLAVVGLANMNAVVCRSGYRGRASWSDCMLEAPGPKTGLLSLLAGKPISLNDLPPLPAKTSNFYACSSDFSKGYTAILDMVRKGSKLGPPGVDAVVDGVLDQLPAIIGFDPRKDLLDHFGDVVCIYDDPNQGPFGIGVGIVVKVKNAKGLRRTLNDLLERAGTVAPRDQFHVWRKKSHGQEIVTVEIAHVANPSFVVTDGWMCIGLFPQTVEAFLLRLDKKLPSWKPSFEQQQALAEMPKRFSSITITDPRETYRLLVGLAPALMSAAKFGLSKAGAGVKIDDFPIAVSDLPPAEVVTNPLFPNVSMRTVNKDGIRWQSRSSLSGFFGADSVSAIAVGAALLLPAVQQARIAARRSSSKNNLKQIALALHNYHDVYKHFPRGTIENDKLKPDQRLSWMVSILPFVEQNALYNRIDQKKGWKDAANASLMKTRIDTFENPQVDIRSLPGYGTTNYIGIAGVGKDSLTAKAHNKKTGVFGYNRVTSFRDITDGTSNTIMTSEASGSYGRWGAGGKATIRAFTKKPYYNGPDGIGGPFPGGWHIGLADGSVRFVSKNINAKVLEALATAQGGEAVGGF
jgi:Protein of unknown function (DUF1559)